MNVLVLRQPCEVCGSATLNWDRRADHHHLVVDSVLDPDKVLRITEPTPYGEWPKHRITVADVVAALEGEQ